MSVRKKIHVSFRDHHSLVLVFLGCFSSAWATRLWSPTSLHLLCSAWFLSTGTDQDFHDGRWIQYRILNRQNYRTRILFWTSIRWQPKRRRRQQECWIAVLHCPPYFKSSRLSPAIVQPSGRTLVGLWGCGPATNDSRAFA